MGLDGYILTGFILGIPANEIVLPIIIMCYTGGSGLISIENIADIQSIFVQMVGLLLQLYVQHCFY